MLLRISKERPRDMTEYSLGIAILSDISKEVPKGVATKTSYIIS